MALETGSYISDLNTSNPASSDSKSSGDDHLRLIKTTIKATFPNITGAVTPTHTEINAAVAASFSQGVSFRNKIINGGFAVNQRAYASGAAVGAGLYGHDRWKMAASGDTYTFSTTNNKTTVTIPAGKVLQQVVEGLNLQTGTYVLSWEGTAQGKIGAGSLGDSGVTGSITGGTNTTIEFGPGTVANIQLETGSVATPFESRPYGVELALCHRYCPVFDSNGQSNVSIGIGEVSSTSGGGVQFQFPVPVRAKATGVTVSAVGDFRLYDYSTGILCNSATFSNSTLTTARVAFGSASTTLTAGRVLTLQSETTSAKIIFTGCEL